MSEFLDHPDSERLPLKVRFRMDSVKAVIAGLTKQVVQEPIPAMSDHYRPPEEPTVVVVPQPEVGVGYTEKDAYVAPVSQERHTSPNFYL